MVAAFWPDMAVWAGGGENASVACLCPPGSAPHCAQPCVPSNVCPSGDLCPPCVAMPRLRTLTHLLPLLLLLLPHARCALHPYDGVFQPLGDAFVYRAGREGLFKSRSQGKAAGSHGVADGESFIRLAEVEFIRPKHVAENFGDVADDRVTGSLTAVVFKARPSPSLHSTPRALCPHSAGNTHPGVGAGLDWVPACGGGASAVLLHRATGGKHALHARPADGHHSRGWRKRRHAVELQDQLHGCPGGDQPGH
jgi:hypothetical protein